jgi:hypothetical protein
MKTKCKFCGESVNLNDEGATYRDGTCAHEECHDNSEFERENAADLADHNPNAGVTQPFPRGRWS